MIIFYPSVQNRWILREVQGLVQTYVSSTQTQWDIYFGWEINLKVCITELFTSLQQLLSHNMSHLSYKLSYIIIQPNKKLFAIITPSFENSEDPNQLAKDINLHKTVNQGTTQTVTEDKKFLCPIKVSAISRHVTLDDVIGKTMAARNGGNFLRLC